MEEVVWIEVLSHQREVVSRQRMVANTITIGRAYDNDLVFDDAQMAAHHVHLARDDNGIWFAEDLGSVNGTSVNGVRHQRVLLDGDAVLQAGQIRVRLRTSAYVVEAEVRFERRIPYWPIAILFFVLALALVLLGQWLDETGEPKPTDYLGPVLMCAIVAAAWTSAWSVLSRIFSGNARYSLHLLIFGAGLLVFTLFAQASEMASYALSWTGLATHVHVIGWLMFAGICFAHLRAIGRGQVLLKAISVIGLAALGVTMQSLQQSEQRAASGRPVTLQRLEPPALRVVHAQTETAFFAGALHLRTTLDKARMHASIGGADGGNAQMPSSAAGNVR